MKNIYDQDVYVIDIVSEKKHWWSRKRWWARYAGVYCCAGHDSQMEADAHAGTLIAAGEWA